MEKKSLSQLRNEVQASKQNSDLLNIANKLEQIAFERTSMDKQEKALLELAARIESGEQVSVEELLSVYHGEKNRNR